MKRRNFLATLLAPLVAGFAKKPAPGTYRAMKREDFPEWSYIQTVGVTSHYCASGLIWQQIGNGPFEGIVSPWPYPPLVMLDVRTPEWETGRTDA